MGELAFLAETEAFLADEVAALELDADGLRARVRGHAGRAAAPDQGRDPTTGSRFEPAPEAAGARGRARRLMELQPVERLLWEVAGRRGARTCACPRACSPTRSCSTRSARDQSLEQLQNVATLPGIVGAALAMPDIHQGYGFPVGGVAATALPDGVVSPGGVGYDINCGVRLLALPVARARARRARASRLVHELVARVPAGAGRSDGLALARRGELDRVLRDGPRALVDGHGLGTEADLEHTESRRPPRRRRPGGGLRARAGRAAPASSARSARATTSWRSSAWSGSSTPRRRRLRARGGRR